MHTLTNLIFSFFIGISSTTAANLPRHYLIPNVPQFDEITGLNCGPATIQSVFAYWGQEVSQREIADVARTSSAGTYVFDMLRAGHFSNLSDAQGRFYPNDVPNAGYTARGLGYAAFAHAQDTPWLDELKALVAQDIPPILLMTYDPSPDSGGHYRVMVGYDDDLQQAYFIDPWGRSFDRNANPDGTMTWSYADLLTAWDYAAYGTAQPYYAVVLLPWRVTLNLQYVNYYARTFKLIARAEYPCPAPFDCNAYPASNVELRIDLPAQGYLIAGNDTVALGEISAGQSARAEWMVGGFNGITPFKAYVTVAGDIHGAVPPALWTGNHVSYPLYTYSDRIGGKATLALP